MGMNNLMKKLSGQLKRSVLQNEGGEGERGIQKYMEEGKWCLIRQEKQDLYKSSICIEAPEKWGEQRKELYLAFMDLEKGMIKYVERNYGTYYDMSMELKNTCLKA